MGPDYDRVVPCQDKAAALPGVIARIPGARAIVVDNASIDGIADVAVLVSPQL